MRKPMYSLRCVAKRSKAFTHCAKHSNLGLCYHLLQEVIGVGSAGYLALFVKVDIHEFAKPGRIVVAHCRGIT
jgi:hypothetical protein